MQSWASGGLGIGGVLAIVLSWQRNQSILWAIVHAILGWFYVFYYLLTRSKSSIRKNR